MSFEICFRRWLIAQPFIGSKESILRTSRSRVPCTRSAGRLTRDSPLGYRVHGIIGPLGKQGVSGQLVEYVKRVLEASVRLVRTTTETFPCAVTIRRA